MKKAKVLLAGALVLALGLVMGCKGLGSGDESVTKDGAKKLSWNTTNEDSQNYRRFFQQFGSSSYKLTEGVVKLTMKYPGEGKTGIVFGLTENKQGNKDTVNFYVFGIGEKKGGSTELQWYVDYYSGVDKESLTTSSSSDKIGGTQKELQGLTDVDASKFPHTKGSPVEAWVDLEYNSDAETYTITFGPGETTRGAITYTTPKHSETSATTDAQGVLGAYGMLSMADAGVTHADNTYEVISSKPNIVLAAEEE